MHCTTPETVVLRLLLELLKLDRLSAAAVPAAQTSAPQTLTALQRLDWFIRIRFKKFQLKQSYSILFFLGPVPEHVEQWRSSPYLVGCHCGFVNSQPQQCDNCQENIDVITEGFIYLDDSLEQLGYGQKTEEQIEKFIRDELRWRIQKVKLPSFSSLSHGS
jgi:tyrosinase